MREGVKRAVEQDELRKVLSQTAYSYFGEKMAPELVEKRISDLNENSSVPLDEEEIELILETAKKDRKSKKENKDNTKQTSFIDTDDFMAEQILATDATRATDANGKSRFLKYDKKTGGVEEVESVTIGNMTYEPICDDLTAKGAVWLPSGASDYGDTATLVKELKDFMFNYFELSSFYEEFLPYLVLFYWVYDKFPFIPYVHFVGLTGTGKTTAQEVLGSVCYKPIDASGSLTLSPIFRTASKWGGTLLLDEFEPDGEGYKEMLLFLKSTVSDKVILKTEGDSKREVVAYLAKCPKIFTSENPINNAGLQSRTMVIQMERNKRRIPLYRLGKFHLQARQLRNKLLKWRFDHYNKINMDDIEYGFEELECFDRRVQQVITPIYYFSDDATKSKIIEFAVVQQEETMKERRDSLEGQIFQYIVDNYPNPITVKGITDEINSDKRTNFVSEKKIANLIRKVLKFKIDRIGHENIRTVILENKESELQSLSNYYGLPLVGVAQVARVAQDAKVEIERADSVISATDTATDPKEYFQEDLLEE